MSPIVFDTEADTTTTLQMWVYREPVAWKKGEASIVDGKLERAESSSLDDTNEILFEHKSVFRLFFAQENAELLTLECFGETENAI